jgi:uncharacterized protein (TIGR02145 family)
MKVSISLGCMRRDYHRYNATPLLAVFMIFPAFLFLSCESLPKRTDDNHVIDIAEVQLGDQVWMAENFQGAIFRNGDSIPHVRSVEGWERAGREGKPAWCEYGNDASNGEKYGRIYNWYAVNDPRGFCPKGWHVPTNDEWIIVEEFLGTSEAGRRLKCMADTMNNGNTTTPAKFCALLGGYRSKEGNFSGLEEFTYLSSSSERDRKENDIWGRGIHQSERTIMRCGLYKAHGLYVRLIKDNDDI